MKQGFDRIDKDGSGFIEKSELEEMIRQFQDRPRGPRDGDRPGEGGERDRERKRPDVE